VTDALAEVVVFLLNESSRYDAMVRMLANYFLRFGGF
jgi:hypothetical protein